MYWRRTRSFLVFGLTEYNLPLLLVILLVIYIYIPIWISPEVVKW